MRKERVTIYFLPQLFVPRRSIYLIKRKKMEQAQQLSPMKLECKQLSE